MDYGLICGMGKGLSKIAFDAVRQGGFEPSTPRLKAGCSATELLARLLADYSMGSHQSG